MEVMRLIAGSGRSGTTWVQDSLAIANHLRPVFEPLHPYVSEMGNRYAHRALSAEDDHPELRQFLDDVCAGRCHTLWTKYRRLGRWLLPPPERFWSLSDAARLYRSWGKFLWEFPKLAIAGRRGDPLIKCIRANLMLGWLSRRCGCSTVLIVRHPGAVIESELRGAWTAKFVLDRFRADSRLHEMTGDRYLNLLERDLTPVEALAARWVIENQWVIEQAPANGVTVVFYERLMSSPDSEWQRVRRALKLPSLPGSAVLSQPSQQSSSVRSAATASASDVPRWMHAMSDDQIAMIQGVLNQAGFDLYSMADPDPRDRNVESAFDNSTSVAR